LSDVKRRYDATTRQRQARDRRSAVVAAARELFERDGFRATTIADIARGAGVSAEMVYKSFGSKASVAKAVFDVTLAGDDEPVAIAERPEADAIQHEPDVRRKIALFVHGLVQRIDRSAKVQILIRDGRHVDDSLIPVWEKLNEEGLTGMRRLGRHLLQTGGLRAGITLAEVRDVLWSFLAVDHYERFVLERGWSLSRYERWLTTVISASILE
jgi:AcrR family transcriptional regulator